MWVFIDDVLVLDLGGIHERSNGSINFRTGAVSNHGSATTLATRFAAAGKTWDPNATHTIEMFYLERGGCYSNLKLNFNLPVIKAGNVEVSKTVEGGQAAYNDSDFNFTLYVETGYNTNQFAVPQTVAATKVLSDGTSQTLTVQNGLFTLKNGERIVFNGLNDELRYYVVETDLNGAAISEVAEIVNNQEVQSISLSSEVHSADVTGTPALIGGQPQVGFVNRLREVDVTVIKQWSGAGSTLPEQDIRIALKRSVLGGEIETVAYDSDGDNVMETEFILNSGNNWQMTFSGLPEYQVNPSTGESAKYTYSVVEVQGAPGYTPTYAEPVIDEAGNITLELTNVKGIDISVSKTWAPDASTAPPQVAVELYRLAVRRNRHLHLAPPLRLGPPLLRRRHLRLRLHRRPRSPLRLNPGIM